MDDLRDLAWDLDGLPIRDLAERIVEEKLDRVTVFTSELGKLPSLERLGYPHHPAAPERRLDGSPRFGSVLLPHLHLSVLPIREYSYVVTDEDIRAFGNATGDLNPIHFNDEVARGLGFDQRISHGMIFNGWLSRVLGTEFPGQGTIYLRSNCIYLAPVYPDVLYSVRLSVPLHDGRRGTYRIVAQLTKAGGGLAVIAYADVKKRPE